MCAYLIILKAQGKSRLATLGSVLIDFINSILCLIAQLPEVSKYQNNFNLFFIILRNCIGLVCQQLGTTFSLK